MSEQRVSRPEIIGILVGFAGAATLTGAIMMVNVWPALTTPPLVLDSPQAAEPAPKKAERQKFTLNFPAPAKPAARTQAPAPAPAAAKSVAAPATTAPVLQLPLAHPNNILASTPPAVLVASAQTAKPSAPAAPASVKSESATDNKGAKPETTAQQAAATPDVKAKSTSAPAQAKDKSAKTDEPAKQASDDSAPQPDVKAQIAAASSASTASAPTSAQATPGTQSAGDAPQILLSDSSPAQSGAPVQTKVSDAAKGDTAKADDAKADASKFDDAEGTTASTGGAMSVVINYAQSSKNAAASAKALAAALRKKGYDVDTNTVDDAVGDNEVKFFHAHDKAAATKLKSIAGGLRDSKGRHRGYEVKDASADSAPPAPGRIEIWLKGS